MQGTVKIRLTSALALALMLALSCTSCSKKNGTEQSVEKFSDIKLREYISSHRYLEGFYTENTSIKEIRFTDSEAWFIEYELAGEHYAETGRYKCQLNFANAEAPVLSVFINNFSRPLT